LNALEEAAYVIHRIVAAQLRNAMVSDD